MALRFIPSFISIIVFFSFSAGISAERPVRCRVKGEKALLIEALSLLRTIKEEKLPCIAELLFQFIDGDKVSELG